MWRTRTLERAWRRLGVVPGAVPPERARDEDDAGGADPDALAVVDLVVSFTQAEHRRFCAALSAACDDAGPIDTPVRLATALDRHIRRTGGRGRPSVTRSPAGVYTPEYWRIRVEGADGATRSELERLSGRRLDA